MQIAACTAGPQDGRPAASGEWVWMHERSKTRPEGAPAETPQAKPMPKTAAISDD
jgi:Kdo2-lipid IVA lauroyltransferase/acyltransferase